MTPANICLERIIIDTYTKGASARLLENIIDGAKGTLAARVDPRMGSEENRVALVAGSET